MAERTMRPNDQALTLRAMNRPAAGDGPGHATRVFSITSGKGGVGKTAVVANLAVLLARMGKRVLILDADPTVDIRNSEKIHRVMLGGRLYDPLTMDEVDTGTRKRQPYWWEADKP